MNMDSKIKILILAGGKGKRMQSELPKVLVKIKGKPMIKHLLEAIKNSGIDENPAITIGYGKDEVVKELGDSYLYAVQSEMLGTGHAVMVAQSVLNEAENILVLYGDSPFIKPETIKDIAVKHLSSENKITMATVTLPDFEDWRSFFYTDFSRIVRDEKGNILKSVEFRDANEEEKKIKEVNPCIFCFNAKWLWQNLENLKNDNAQKEYYLTDLVKVAISEGEKIETINISPEEALAANSKEELEILERFA
jgi:bifunctional UDP-N-acetylglucosamine pyrophosphorylase / glucosamine-1-phosphate N-acetyltransferase